MNRRDRSAGLLAVFALLAIIHTWPLVTAPGVLTRHDNADTYLNQWILAWVAYALPRQPLHLFDANIFYPARHVLAFSEHLIVQGIMGAPLSWAGASPVLVFNVVLLAGLALTGWATAQVVGRWTGDWPSGLLAGSVAAFNTHTLSRLGHVQAVHVEFLPLALFALDRLLVQPRVRRAVALAGWSALQMLCSGYLLVFTAVTLTVGALARADEWLGPGRRRRVLPMLALSGAIASACCLPFLIPYAEVRAEQHLVRPLDEVAQYSASPLDYVTTVANLHYRWWSHRFYRGTDALFPGVVPLALALVAVVTGVAWRDARARMLLAAGLVCFLLSFGPATWPYVWLYHAVPVFEGIRGAARFGYITIFSVGILAGFGLAWIRARAATSPAPRRAALAAGILAVVLVNVEALTAPHDEYTRFDGIPRVYDLLAAEPEAVVVEIPFWPAADASKNGVYVFNSTRHWRPIVNGYSGFTPPTYRRDAERLRSFPDEASLAWLRSLGVTHVVVHLDRARELADRLAAVPALVQVGGGRDIRLYRLRR